MPLPDEIRERYQITGIIGTGGSGVVLRAIQKDLGREVAIKLLHAADETQRSRMRQEGRILAGLAHPNIVQIFDAELGGDHPALVMELVQGRPLAEVMETGVELETAFEMVIQLARVLQFAHDRGIVHRDVKPGNIFVVDGATVKLGDFGLAKKLTSITLDTGSGTILGTPAYMSPEHISARGLGPASDQYSLGILAYELFTGTLPWEGNSPLSCALVRLEAPAQPPSMRAAGLSPSVDRMIERALALDPADRYPRVEEMGEALASILSARRARAIQASTRATIVPPGFHAAEASPGDAPTAGAPPVPTVILGRGKSARMGSDPHAPTVSWAAPAHGPLPRKSRIALLMVLAGLSALAGTGLYVSRRDALPSPAPTLPPSAVSAAAKGLTSVMLRELVRKVSTDLREMERRTGRAPFSSRGWESPPLEGFWRPEDVSALVSTLTDLAAVLEGLPPGDDDDPAWLDLTGDALSLLDRIDSPVSEVTRRLVSDQTPALFMIAERAREGSGSSRRLLPAEVQARVRAALPGLYSAVLALRRSLLTAHASSRRYRRAFVLATLSMVDPSLEGVCSAAQHLSPDRRGGQLRAPADLNDPDHLLEMILQASAELEGDAPGERPARELETQLRILDHGIWITIANLGNQLDELHQDRIGPGDQRFRMRRKLHEVFGRALAHEPHRVRELPTETLYTGTVRVMELTTSRFPVEADRADHLKNIQELVTLVLDRPQPELASLVIEDCITLEELARLEAEMGAAGVRLEQLRPYLFRQAPK